jgi:hypothetical protein
MRTIRIIPSERFRGGWCCDEGDGVQPSFLTRADAIGYAKTRFGGFPEGEIQVYDDKGERVVQTIKMQGGQQFGQPPE